MTTVVPYFATAAAAVAWDGRLSAFGDVSGQAAVVAASLAFEAIAEEYRGVAYTPRDQTDSFEGTSSPFLVLSKTRIISVTTITIDGVVQGATTYRLSGRKGIVVCDYGWFGYTVNATYAHGYASPPNGVLNACTEYVFSLLNARASGTSRNTLSVGSDGGTTRYSTPDWSAGRPTGFLEVDRLLNSLTDERVALA